MTENFCAYCDSCHEMLDFGKNFSGNDTIVCPDRLSDALVQTMPKVHEGLDVEILEEQCH